MKLIVRILSSLFDLLSKFGAIGIAIFSAVIAGIIATILIVIYSLSADSKSRYINTFQYRPPQSTEFINNITANIDEGKYAQEIEDKILTKGN